MTITEIILNVIGGGLLGSLGQGIRIAVGLKKLNEENVSKTVRGKNTEDFSTGRLVLSVFIGFVAGAIGMLTKVADGKNGEYNTEAIVTIMAVGYSGADFIEGVFNTYISKFKTETSIEKRPATSSIGPVLNAEIQPMTVSDEANFDSHQFQG